MHKIAVYLSGRVRGYENTIEKIKEKFFNNYDVDIFVSIDNEKDAYHQHFEDTVKPVGSFYEKYDRMFSQLPVAPAECKHRNSLAMFYHNSYAMKLIMDNIRNNNVHYHAVVKFRVDIESEDSFIIPDNIIKNGIYIPNGNNYRGICDQIAFGDVQSMLIYSTLFMHVHNYIYAKKAFFSPEYLLNFHINENNMNIIRFPYNFNLVNSRFNTPQEHTREHSNSSESPP